MACTLLHNEDSDNLKGATATTEVSLPTISYGSGCESLAGVVADVFQAASKSIAEGRDLHGICSSVSDA